MAMNQKANKICKQWCIDNNKTVCENCGSNQWLTFAHRLKRRHFNSVEELSDPKNFILLCIKCHEKCEFSKELTEEMFSRLR